MQAEHVHGHVLAQKDTNAPTKVRQLHMAVCSKEQVVRLDVSACVCVCACWRTCVFAHVYQTAFLKEQCCMCKKDQEWQGPGNLGGRSKGPGVGRPRSGRPFLKSSMEPRSTPSTALRALLNIRPRCGIGRAPQDMDCYHHCYPHKIQQIAHTYEWVLRMQTLGRERAHTHTHTHTPIHKLEQNAAGE